MLPTIMYTSFPRSACLKILETVSENTISLENHYIPSELRRSFTDPCENHIKTLYFNDVLRLKFFGVLPSVTSSKSRVSTNTMHLMTVIEYEISSEKGGETNELAKP